MLCKYCGVAIEKRGTLWVDSAPVFPQYCKSSQPSDPMTQKHEPAHQQLVCQTQQATLFQLRDNLFTADASDLQLQPGQVPEYIQVDQQQTFRLISIQYTPNVESIACWNYAALDGAKLTIFND